MIKIASIYTLILHIFYELINFDSILDLSWQCSRIKPDSLFMYDFKIIFQRCSMSINYMSYFIQLSNAQLTNNLDSYSLHIKFPLQTILILS